MQPLILPGSANNDIVQYKVGLSNQQRNEKYKLWEIIKNYSKNQQYIYLFLVFYVFF